MAMRKKKRESSLVGSRQGCSAAIREQFSNASPTLQHLNYSFYMQHITEVSGNSRSRPFPRMKASNSLSGIMGMDFFIPFPFPNFGNAFFSFSSRSRIMGMFFFHIFPFPNCGDRFVSFLSLHEFWECFFLFPSRSRI